MSTNNPNPGSIDERLAFLLTSTESLHASTQELHAIAIKHSEQLEQDGKHILAIAEHVKSVSDAVQGLTKIAEAHEDRISDLEGGEPKS